MSKAVLVMDMPSSCFECDFQAMNVRDNPICILCTESCVEQFKTKDEYKRIDTDLRTRPDWCPLNPIPSKKDKPTKSESVACFNSGYNACIDELLGEKE